MVDRSADWIDQAEGDLMHAKHDAEIGYYDWACFSAQQAAEEAVKGVFQKMGQEAWGHSAADLLSSLPEDFRPTGELLDQALELDKAYIPTRYPNAHPSGSPRTRYTKKEAERLVEYATQILHYCKSLLSKIH